MKTSNLSSARTKMRPRRGLRLLTVTAAFLSMLLAIVTVDRAGADEGGISFWLPGEFGSLAAAPRCPDGRLEL